MHADNEANIATYRALRHQLLADKERERKRKQRRCAAIAFTLVTLALLAAAAGPAIDDNADMNATRERAKQIYYAGEGR